MEKSVHSLLIKSKRITKTIYSIFMEEVNGTTIYWLISIGLMIGYVIWLFMGKRCMNLTGNLIGGVTGSVIIGICAIYLNLVGPLVYASIGSLAFLFLVNIFSTKVEHSDQAQTT